MRMTRPRRMAPAQLLGVLPLLPLLLTAPTLATEAGLSAALVNVAETHPAETKTAGSKTGDVNTAEITDANPRAAGMAQSLMMAQSEPPQPELQPIATQVGATLTTGEGTGYESSYGSLDAFIPLHQRVSRDLSFLQSHLLVDTAAGNAGGNLILGYRRFNPQQSRVVGGYLGVDLRNTGKRTISQLGAGFEVIYPTVEFRVNGYLPLGDRDRETASNTSIVSTSAASSPFFLGNALVTTTASQTQRTDRLFETALAGLDAEVGAQLLRWNLDSSLYGYLGAYFYGGPNVSDFVGVRGRLEARLSRNLQAGLSVQSDHEFGTTATANVSLRFGRKPSSSTGSPTRLTDGWAHMGDWIHRQNNVAVTHRTTTQVETVGGQTVALLNPATGQPWFFTHVNLGIGNSNGTFETPYGTVAAAVLTVPQDGNGIIYVQAGTNPGIPGFTVPPNVQALSTGVQQSLPTVQRGPVILPMSADGGILPTVLDTVKLSNNTTLSGFNVTPPDLNSGITANNVQNVIVRQNQVAVNGDDTPGIRLENVAGVATVTGNRVVTTGNSTNEVFTRNADGIQIVQANTALSQLSITNNIVTTSGRDTYGIWVITSRDNSPITTATISGNTVGTTGASEDGIVVQAGSQIANLTVSNNLLQPAINSIRLQKLATQTVCAAIKNNRFTAGGGTISLSAGLSATGTVQPFRVVDLNNLHIDNPGSTAAYDGLPAPTASFVNANSCP
jgi:trimeric autotransporter adhesin